ncbi:hypothetical protein HMPREF9332_01373 [Alloprevotella rava F0323]|uniref:2-amino-4-hydroxy-6-hydroxymethyldihydropteridine pyrophosphokinase n=1 Tax=Alloprevotella rava F0323 TaxID=679199 RepID=G5GCS2_9BACT|nr:hypothetical protein HMPREF9332_01373 [Alloprevotella rava F0323]
MSTIYIGLGSNLGNRRENLERAVTLLEQRVGTLLRLSAFLETAPVGFESEHQFLNAAAAFRTSLSPEELLPITQQIEREMGRTQKSLNGVYHDRTIDIDLLCSDGESVHTAELQLPHPHLSERRFVLEPLAEIAPELWIDGQGYVLDLLDKLNGHNIRPLTPADTPLFEQFNALFPQLSEQVRPLTADEITTLLQRPDTWVYVAFAPDGRLVGTITLCLAASPTGIKGWAEDLVVDTSVRGAGFGKALILRSAREAFRHGADSVNFTSRPSRTAANNLYVSLGFEQRETNVYRCKRYDTLKLR